MTTLTTLTTNECDELPSNLNVMKIFVYML